MSNTDRDGAQERGRVGQFKWWLVTNPVGRWFTALATLLLTAVAVGRPELMDPILWLVLALFWVGEGCIMLSELISRV